MNNDEFERKKKQLDEIDQKISEITTNADRKIEKLNKKAEKIHKQMYKYSEIKNVQD